MKTKMPTEVSTLVSLKPHHKDTENDLIIQFIGEFLHSDTLTVEQLNEGYHIRNAEKVVKKLIDAGSVELVPDTKEYRYLNRLPEGWKI